MPLGRAFAAIVASETAYLLLRSIATLVKLRTDYELWPVVIISAVLWPLTFGWAAYVLWRPRTPESSREALLRTGAVALVGFINLILVLALLDRPDMVLRSPF